jgi:hypothetical protein
MGAVEQSSGVVESYLSTLEESYGSFSINVRVYPQNDFATLS